MTYIPEGTFGAPPGAGGKEVWRWNRLNLSQFVSGGSMDFTSGGGGGAWSIANIAERGNVLVYTPAGGTTVTEIAMFSQALVFPDERRDLIFEVELYDVNWGAGGYCGMFFLADGTPNHGFGHLGMGIAEWQTLLNNGVVERDSVTGWQTELFARYIVRGRKPAGAPPEVTSFLEGHERLGSDVASQPRRSGSSAAARGSVNNLGNNSTLGATWNGLNCDRFGLIIASSGGNAPPTQVRISDIRVYQL